MSIVVLYCKQGDVGDQKLKSRWSKTSKKISGIGNITVRSAGGLGSIPISEPVDFIIIIIFDIRIIVH